MCLAPGLVAFSTVNILARAFFALGDTKTPMKISIACLVMNLLLAAALVVPLRQGGLGIANTITSICNVGLLVFALRKKMGTLEMESVAQNFFAAGHGGILAGMIAWFGWRFWENSIGHATIALKIGAVFVPAANGGIGLWRRRARVQNSGGKGDDGICAGEVQNPKLNRSKRRKQRILNFQRLIFWTPLRFLRCLMFKFPPPPSSNSARTWI